MREKKIKTFRWDHKPGDSLDSKELLYQPDTLLCYGLDESALLVAYCYCCSSIEVRKLYVSLLLFSLDNSSIIALKFGC